MNFNIGIIKRSSQWREIKIHHKEIQKRISPIVLKIFIFSTIITRYSHAEKNQTKPYRDHSCDFERILRFPLSLYEFIIFSQKPSHTYNTQNNDRPNINRNTFGISDRGKHAPFADVSFRS